MAGQIQIVQNFINQIQWNLAICTPLYSYNSLFVQHVHKTFDSSFVHCSAIQTHSVIYRAKEDKLQQHSKMFVLVMSTAQCSVVTFFVGSCHISHHCLMTMLLINLFNDNVIDHFKKILKNCQRQTTLDKFIKQKS